MLIYTYAMRANKTYQKIKNFLLKHYTLNSVKHILSEKRKFFPRMEIVILAQKEINVPLDAWQDIRAWIIKQENKRLQKLKKVKK